MYRFVKLLLGCSLLLFSCQEEGIPKAVITLTRQRMEIYQREQDSICQQKARHLAESAVDSLFLSLTQRYLLDSIDIPLKPIKPSVDTNINLENNTPIKPLWDTLKK